MDRAYVNDPRYIKKNDGKKLTNPKKTISNRKLRCMKKMFKIQVKISV